MGQVKKIPVREKVKPGDTWNLASLYKTDDAWEADFRRWEKRVTGYQKFRGKLAQGPAMLARCLSFDNDFERLGERLGIYVFLRTTEDQANDHYQQMMARYRHVASRAGEAASYITPELLSMSTQRIKSAISHKSLAPYRLTIQRLVRRKPHTLTKKEESLLAMQAEMSQVASKTFRQLLDTDLKFGEVKNEKGELVELSNATFSALLHSPKRVVRRNAFHRYYGQFQSHENTLASLLEGSIQRDVYYARARGHQSSLDASLFSDNVPVSVYNNLINAVEKHLPALHRYYELRRRKMRIADIHHYDTYVPILSELQTRHNWNQAVKLIIGALEPLGREYCRVLEKGLSGRWCDRYPNRGKSSGAFSCGSYDGDPYILMNYKPDVLDDVFTLAHEAGHSMHSYYSARHQSFQDYNYTIFVAEVASTFNEQLLSGYLLGHAKDEKQRAYLINRDIDAIRGTIIRQTMFAEFEKITHEMAEAGDPLTVKSFRDVYWKLLQKYFGPDFSLDEELSLECFRIPHFYRAFYVYKYATGLSAAIALSQRVVHGRRRQLQDYLGFLKGGCSKFPLDLLRDAGVDMEEPKPVETALEHFEHLVDELESLTSGRSS